VSEKEKTMKCKNAERLLSRYLDHELDQVRARQLEDHLARCAGCRQELADLAAATDRLRALDAPGPSPFLATRVMAEVRLARRRHRPAWAKLVATAAAVLLVAGGAFAGVNLGTGLAGNGGSTDELLMSPDDTFAGFTESVLVEE
jgi:anti-sigma factor RsiW